MPKIFFFLTFYWCGYLYLINRFSIFLVTCICGIIHNPSFLLLLESILERTQSRSTQEKEVLGGFRPPSPHPYTPTNFETQRDFEKICYKCNPCVLLSASILVLGHHSFIGIRNLKLPIFPCRALFFVKILKY